MSTYSDSVAAAVQTFHANNLTAEENNCVSQIEALRKNLLLSRERMVVRDFGARRPDLRLTSAELVQGETKEIALSELCAKASKSPSWATLLFVLIRRLRPAVCLELGTCLGISAAYTAGALQLNGHGTLVTIEGDETLAAKAREHLASLNFSNVKVLSGRFAEVLPSVLEKIRPLDFVFVDGHHDGEATVSYWTSIKPKLFRRSIVIFDDISWSSSMKLAWKRISKDACVFNAIDLGDIGVVIIDT